MPRFVLRHVMPFRARRASQRVGGRDWQSRLMPLGYCQTARPRPGDSTENEGNTVFRQPMFGVGVLALVAACATTDIQPLTATSFAVTTEADSSCRGAAVRQIALQGAAIEVIKRGGDRFVVTGQGSDSQTTGITYAGFGNWTTSGVTEQSLTVQLVERGQPQYADSLSAREVLGPDWQEKVEKGAPTTC